MPPCDLLLFVEETDIMSYIDYNTPQVCTDKMETTLEAIQGIGKLLVNSFLDNLLQANADIR